MRRISGWIWMVLLVLACVDQGRAQDGVFMVKREVSGRRPGRIVVYEDVWRLKLLENGKGWECRLLHAEAIGGDNVFNTKNPAFITLWGTNELNSFCLFGRSFPWVEGDSSTNMAAMAALMADRAADWELKANMVRARDTALYRLVESDLKKIGGLLAGKGTFTAGSGGAGQAGGLVGSDGDGSVGRVSDGTAVRVDGQRQADPIDADMQRVLVKGSFHSRALGELAVTDSARVAAYFAKYDPIYGQQNFYRILRCNVLMRDLEHNFQPYDSVLLLIPDSLLALDQINLGNKLTEEANISADKAYATIQYYKQYKDGFSQWVQVSFSQAFLGPDRKEEPLLLDRLIHDKDTTVVNEILPMYWWAQSKKHKNNGDSLLIIAQELKKLNDPARYDNPYRYSLLVYQELEALGPRYKKEASALLDEEIAGLEESIRDSLSAGRAARRNILAYAYKLKSDEVKNTDPKASMLYLSRAAIYSPRNEKEMVYESYYDRAFLHSEKSYRPVFAEALIKEGKSKEAMAVMTEQLNDDPAFLLEMQKAFEKSFPNLDFYKFFSDGVMASWKVAPNFSLKSADGKTTRSLSDYKGKWVLIDFWGTWCAPCREEMPKIDAFVRKIQTRNDLAFVSIACKDSKENVMLFTSEHGYVLPVVMSDGMVENKYEVSGYPSKCLVSPDGKMMPVYFGVDWEKVTDIFAAIKPKTSKSGLKGQVRN